MTTTLPPHVEEYVTEMVEDGWFPSREALLCEAIDALQAKLEHERKLADLRYEIAKGDASAGSGRDVELDDLVVASILNRAFATRESDLEAAHA